MLYKNMGYFELKLHIHTPGTSEIYFHFVHLKIVEFWNAGYWF